MFLIEKRDGTIIGRMYANKSIQRQCIPKEEALSPTVTKEFVLITRMVEAKQRRDMMTLNIHNTFTQTNILNKDNNKIIMKIRDSLSGILLEIDKDKYEDFVICCRKEKLLYVKMLKVLCGMLIASILYYKNLRKDIKQ